jgi:hypothetical protein
VFIRQAKIFLEEQYFRVVEQYVAKSGMKRTGDINPLKAIQLFVKRKFERTPVDLNWVNNFILYQFNSYINIDIYYFFFLRLRFITVFDVVN